jgi:murein DD-endopeptidase MepM/ murein hydrolase activator NlpD
MGRGHFVIAAGAMLALACERPEPTLSPAPPAESVAPSPGETLAATPPPPAAPPVAFDVQVARVKPRKTLATTLVDLGLPNAQVNEIIGALSGVFEFRKSRAGDQIRVTSRQGQVEYLEYRSSPVDEWYVRRDGERMVAGKRPIEVEKRVVSVGLSVESSLYESMVTAGEDPSLAMAIADVFAWDVDFYVDVRKGDQVRVVVEKYLTRGRVLRYGEVLGASYEGSSVGGKRYLRYTPLTGSASYFDENGRSAKRPFLRSPLKYSVVTSGFGTRALKLPYASYVHQHQGIDYAAAPGTPVWAVADGTVSRAVYGDRTAGNYIFLRHANGLETGYLHLSKLGEGIRVGARVEQKQVIGFTGATGMVTGPHLHYAVRRGGGFMNPNSLKFPRSEPLPKAELPRFLEQTTELAARLSAVQIAAR